MQHQQPGSGGGVAPPPVDLYGGEEDHKLGDLGIAEAASPISSRPPASAAINFEEMLQATAEAGGGSSGNRWPRQETLALLQIRSEMDAAFRDATLKGPLWEQVSRKLGELGYNRSAKKCKEKFENVHKYYKRTKEGRGGRQDGKTYKFFTQLEALNLNIATGTTTATPVASFPPPAAPILSLPPPVDQSLFENIHLSLSFDSSSSSDDEQEMEMEMETGTNPSNRKRKRERGSTSGGDEKMMDFFEGLLKQVMQKQEGMQHKFLEAIEKREQDRMIREEAWKRQDLARLAREHDLMAQERAVSASRDAAIVSFLEKITGQTIHLPTAAAPPPPAPPPPAPPQPLHQNVDKKIIESPPFQSPTVAAAPPEQRMMVPFGQQQDLSSSRWPKTEVLALIQLRSGMDTKYQDVGPKGVLWEEISAGMQRLGYNRSAKRCKEKWENINKYFKKVKESNKKRPEDAKTCPYFHELDALYRRKALGSKGQTSAGGSETGALISSAPFGGGDDNTGGENQPEDMLIRKQNEGIIMDKCSNNSNSDNNYEDLVDENEEEIEYHDDYDDKTEDEMKMLYKIQFSNGGGTTGTGTPSNSTFITMVQ